MQLVRRLRIPALLCALAVLVCELISRPYTNMGICDDGPYILMARTLAATGHIVYNGPTTPMLGWQLYLAAAFIKLFGFSFTTVRMSTLLVAMVTAFILQRTLVRAHTTERNATLATLALVLSPLYLMLSVTFMTDITGLFAVILCLYSCLRALQASTSRATIGWLCFAVGTNALCGTSRQIAWLGILVMLPSTLWLLRAQRRDLQAQRRGHQVQSRVLLAGAAATLAGALFILVCMHWFSLQPYNVHEHLRINKFPVVRTLLELIHIFLDIPFLLLPLVALFLPEVRKSRPRTIAILSASLLGYISLALLTLHTHHIFWLEPTKSMLGDWVGVHGIFEGTNLKGHAPIFLHSGIQTLLTIASLGGLIGLIVSLLGPTRTAPAADSSASVSWKQLLGLAAPFAIAYCFLLIPRATIAFGIYDRYALELLPVATLCLVRYYQDRIHPRLPLASVFLVAIMAIYGITVTHNTFALYRARVALAAELHANGIPDTSVDNGWEYNLDVELQHADHINDPRITVPAHAYVATPPLPAGTCPMLWYDETLHIHPLYGVSFVPNACYGPAPFAPVHYSRWLASAPGTLYVVRYTRLLSPELRLPLAILKAIQVAR